MSHRHGKWAAAILSAQQQDGTWGAGFHGMAQPTNAPLTTEQALRRLHALGFTREDEPIRRCVDTLAACLRGERKIDTYWEKGIDWAMYEPLMLSAWIRRFDPDQPDALVYAKRWAKVIEAAFAEARTVKGKPTAIIAKTVKGKGVSYMEDQVGWHGSAPNDEQYAIAVAEIKATM